MCQDISMKSTSLYESPKASGSTFTRLCKKVLRRKSSSSSLKKKKEEEEPSELEASSTSSSTLDSEERERDSYSGEIERVFRYIDADGDGKISPRELRRCVKAIGLERLTAEEAAAAVESSDSDGDGLLSLADFERLMGGEGLSEEDRTAELRAAFSAYHDHELGCITPRSLGRMMARLGDTKSPRECQAIIRAFDQDGDGVLSFHEFAAMMR